MSLRAADGGDIPWGSLATGVVVSLVIGVLALHLLLKAVDRTKLHYFAVYCLALGLTVLLFGT